MGEHDAGTGVLVPADQLVEARAAHRCGALLGVPAVTLIPPAAPDLDPRANPRALALH